MPYKVERKDMQISEIQEHVAELTDLHGWHETSLEQGVMLLVTEVGEVTKDVLSLLRAQKRLDEAAINQIKENLGMEIFDVMWNLFNLANLAGIDLETAFTEKIRINRGRTWGEDVK